MLPTYRELVVLLIIIYSAFYFSLMPITNDTYSHANMVDDLNISAYPPLFHLLVKTINFFSMNGDEKTLTKNTTIFNVFLLGSLITLVLLPYAVYEFFFAYLRSEKAAFLGFLAYLFGTGITNTYYYSNVWAQALAMFLFLCLLICLINKKPFTALIFLVLIGFTHRHFIYYAVIVYIVYFFESLFKNFELPTIYCTTKSGSDASFSLSCLLPMFLIVFPFPYLWGVIKAHRRDIVLFSSIVPVFLVFLDSRVLLASFTLWCGYIGSYLTGLNRTKLAVWLIFFAVFAVFSYFYMMDLAASYTAYSAFENIVY